MDMTQKMFGIKVDTLVKKASDSATWFMEDYGGPRVSHEDTYDHWDRVCARTANTIMSKIPNETRQNAIDENGNVKIWMKIHAGSKNYRDCYMEMTDDGYYLYPNAAAIDAGNRKETLFVDTARDAVNLYAVTVVANEERRMARESFVNDFTKEERLERDRLKRLTKKDPAYKDMLDGAQKDLIAKREQAYREQAYKDLLIPGPLENITTMSDSAVNKIKKYGVNVYDVVKKDSETEQDFADAVASISESGQVMEQ